MRTKRTKKILIILVCVGVLIASCTYWLNYLMARRDVNPSASACEEKAVHDISGAEYIVSECFLGKDGGNNFIRLRVYSKDRALLAERFFMQDWEEWGAYGLEEDGKSIFYVAGVPRELSHIQLPPTRLDWLRARLP